MGHRPLLTGEARELLGSACLSDARLAAQEHQPSAPVGCGAKRAFEVAEKLRASDEGRGCHLGPILDLGDLRDETHPAAANGPENGLATSIVPQHPSGLIECLAERLIGDDGVRPHVREQLGPGDDATPEADQVEDELQRLLLNRNPSAVPAKLAEMEV